MILYAVFVQVFDSTQCSLLRFATSVSTSLIQQTGINIRNFNFV